MSQNVPVRIIGSPDYFIDEEDARDRAGVAYDHCYDPAGSIRQALAPVASGDRTEQQRKIQIPTLVIHGCNDKMCDVSGGEAAASAIPDAQLKLFDGMGHNLPHELWPQIANEIADHINRSE